MEEIKSTAKDRMEKTLEALARDFTKSRTGRASASLVENIKVEYYGNLTPLNQVASVAVPDSRTITIQPWDKSGFAAIDKAIQKSDLGINPVNDGKIIRVVIPPLTEERRKELVKLAKKYGEEAKVALRNIRREANEALKKKEKDKVITEDEHHKGSEDIQKLTDAYVTKIDERCAAKEKEVMEI